MDGNDVVKVGGEWSGSVLLLGRHLTVPNPQEDKKKENDIELYSVETQWNPKRTEQRTNYYMS